VGRAVEQVVLVLLLQPLPMVVLPMLVVALELAVVVRGYLGQQP